MKTVAAIVVVFATIKGSVAQTLTLPTCGATCMVSSGGVTSCSVSDLSCLCTNTDYINTVIPCIANSCDATDAQDAYAYAEYACSTVGVTTPSVCSVLGNCSPGPGPAPAPTPPAPAPAPAPAPSPAPATATTAGSGTPTASSPVVTFEGAASRNGIGWTGYAGIIALNFGAGIL